jgi:hypothetical protein
LIFALTCSGDFLVLGTGRLAWACRHMQKRVHTVKPLVADQVAQRSNKYWMREINTIVNATSIILHRLLEFATGFSVSIILSSLIRQEMVTQCRDKRLGCASRPTERR